MIGLYLPSNEFFSGPMTNCSEPAETEEPFWKEISSDDFRNINVGQVVEKYLDIRSQSEIKKVRYS